MAVIMLSLATLPGTCAGLAISTAAVGQSIEKAEADRIPVIFKPSI